MGALAQRRIAGKTLWKVYGERREAFGKIDAITMIYKNGLIGRLDALRLILEKALPTKITSNIVGLADTIH